MANEKRLIDADKAKEDFNLYFGSVSHAVIANRILDEQPTVEAVEVVHGQWLDGWTVKDGKVVSKSIDCSYCEGVFKIEIKNREYWKEKLAWCPFCGAKMDGDWDG